ncbi:protein phosphatase 2C domain-containing protein [Acuticoccus mangrovi]|uniref:Protein phosphatase 2C domain-containing protein n=1 Tax=Acuticoccus mangrovi TaxID=2796142 RepID=A0A934IPB9_9HYPH|nr:protein phosphatase 2C domain-containing protein [Acuticoccus mangrovi]MBJ3775119.1 protein phosphatase 2C domain-containing protein [Acuticoccus mangrovi]
MTLSIVDAVSDPGRTGRANEDGYGSGGRFAWIIDGATGLSDAPLLDAPSDAAWLTAVANQALSELAPTALDAGALLADAARIAERRFLAERKRSPAERYEIPTAAVLLAEFGDGVVAIAELGDCGVYIDTDAGLTRIGGSERGKALEQENARRLGGGRGPEVVAFLRRLRNFANTPDGYAIFAPEANSADRARRHRVATEAGRALFVTDGFEAAIDYGLYDGPALILEAERELGGALGALRAAERDDPDCTRFPRFKPSDDATAMLVRFGGVQPR